jgi:xanthine dehydrogenase accessory factor
MMEWVALLRDIAPVEPVAMISILATEGSAPREAGTRMLVTAGGQRGTIGGGALELQATEQARSILKQSIGAWRIQDYPLGPLLGQCCGGRVRLLVEHIDPKALGWLQDVSEEAVLVSHLKHDRVVRQISNCAAPELISARGDRPKEGARFAEQLGHPRRPIYLFGAGHVGQAIARHAVGLPLGLAWFDTRPVFADVEGVAIVPDDAIVNCVVEAPDDAAILIMTHDHGLDYRLTRQALQRPATALIGVIGSATKRARFLSRLEKDGVSAEVQARLCCPIGVDGVAGKEPDVIAISVLAQLLQLDRV